MTYEFNAKDFQNLKKPQKALKCGSKVPTNFDRGKIVVDRKVSSILMKQLPLQTQGNGEAAKIDYEITNSP